MLTNVDWAQAAEPGWLPACVMIRMLFMPSAARRKLPGEEGSCRDFSCALSVV